MKEIIKQINKDILNLSSLDELILIKDAYGREINKTHYDFLMDTFNSLFIIDEDNKMTKELEKYFLNKERYAIFDTAVSNIEHQIEIIKTNKTLFEESDDTLYDDEMLDIVFYDSVINLENYYNNIEEIVLSLRDILNFYRRETYKRVPSNWKISKLKKVN